MNEDPEDQPTYSRVKVRFSDVDYLSACGYYGDEDREAEWIQLADLLHDRTSWYFEITSNGEPLWSLGDFGGSTLNIGLNSSGFNCFDIAGDASRTITDIDGVRKWVEDNEDEARRFPIEFARDANWLVLQSIVFTVSVQTIEDKYCGVVEGILGEAIIADSFNEVVEYARTRILEYFAAPSAIGPELLLRLVVDEVATRRFLENL